MQVRHLLEGVAILWADIEHLATGDELRLVIPQMPAVARRHDHDLAEFMIVNGKTILRYARLDGDEL